MRSKTTKTRLRLLSNSAALCLIGGVAAGCSSDVSRFTDSFYTSAVPQRQQQPAPVQQAYPAEVDTTYTGSVHRGAVTPARLASRTVPGGRVTPRATVGAPTYAAVAPAAPRQLRAPTPQRQPLEQQRHRLAPMTSTPTAVERRADSVALAPVAVDRMATGSTVRAVASPAPQLAPVAAPQGQTVSPGAPRASGWTATGGTQITLREGETIYNLSRRFGVPVDAILKVNGIANPKDVSAGQTIVVPTYVYSQKAPVSMPDSNPQTAIAKSSRGTKYDIAPDQVPIPTRAPSRDYAVLPQPPATKTRDVPQQSASTAPSPGSSVSGQYTVASGDTLYGISRRTGVGVDRLKAANGLSDGTIRVGQKLVIPAAGQTAPVQVAAASKTTAPAGVDPIVTGSARAPKASETRADEKVISDAVTGTTEAAPQTTGIAAMRWPARGRVIESFGSTSGGKRNDGIDIAVPAGTAVKAAENGVVIYAGDGLKEYGNTVLVRHEDGLVTVYGHADALNVQRGDKVRRGQQIATAGTSGSATVPKLHFEIRKNAVPVDPARYLR